MDEISIDEIENKIRDISDRVQKKNENERQKQHIADFLNRNGARKELFEDRKEELSKIKEDFSEGTCHISGTIESAIQHQSVDVNFPDYSEKNFFFRKIFRFLTKDIYILINNIINEQKAFNNKITQSLGLLRDNQLRLSYFGENLNCTTYYNRDNSEDAMFLAKRAYDHADGSYQYDDVSNMVLWNSRYYLNYRNQISKPKEDEQIQREYYLTHYIIDAVRSCSNGMVLDLGCGEGEWMELLASKNYSAVGIDISEAALKTAEKKGLQVVLSDCLEYMRNMKADSVKLITAFHLIEYLPLNKIIEFVQEIDRVVMNGGMVIIETPDPFCVQEGLNNFYTDPLRLRPIHPDFLKSIFLQNGFEFTEIVNCGDREKDQRDSWCLPDYALIARKSQ